MSCRAFLDDKVTLHTGDCREVLAQIPDASVDSVVTDPPYGLGFMGKAWDAADGAPFAPELWAHVLRVLKPGGHVVAFSGTRTYHRMAVAIEDAGFEIRDQLGFCYGSGFPKSLDVSKAIDKAAGAEREVLGVREYAGGHVQRSNADKLAPPIGTFVRSQDDRLQTAPATDAAREWQGWGTALKPAWEPICLARKPLVGTVAANVLAHGTGALNIDGCRVETSDQVVCSGDGFRTTKFAGAIGKGDATLTGERWQLPPQGRWPANIIHDGSEEVLAGFPETQSGKAEIGAGRDGNHTLGIYGAKASKVTSCFADQGSAARFFYTAKADADDRLGSKHPTVKPLDLMQWLVRLVTPRGGTVLDPFAGTGTTGEAAWREGMRAILIEREAEYQDDIARRMDLAAKPTKRQAVAKTKNTLVDPNTLPLFRGAAE